MARPERVELPTFWFVAKQGTKAQVAQKPSRVAPGKCLILRAWNSPV